MDAFDPISGGRKRPLNQRLPKPPLLRRPESRRAEVPKAVADSALARHRLEVAGLVGLPGNPLPSLSAIYSATPMRASRSIPVSCPMPRKR